MNHEQIEAFVAVLRESSRLTEVEVRQEGSALRLRRAPATASGKRIVAHSPASSGRALLSNGETSGGLMGASQETTLPSAPKPVVVTSQIVGIFRGVHPNPVTPGDRVKENQILGQIEVMRLMNDIPAPASGRVQAVLVQEGQPVEYGQPLFEIVEGEEG